MFPYVSYVLPCLGDSLASLVIILCHTAIRCYPIDLVLVAALSVPSQGPMSLPKNALSPPERCHRGWEPWEPMGDLAYFVVRIDGSRWELWTWQALHRHLQEEKPPHA